MARLDEFLARLEGVRARGEGRWLARCTAHEDRSPSLSIAMRDGKILLKCFAGCSAYDVVSAAGMELSDLMPENVGYSRGVRIAVAHGYRHEWFDKLLYESAILALYLDRAWGLLPGGADLARARAAIAAIDEIRGAYGGKH